MELSLEQITNLVAGMEWIWIIIIIGILVIVGIIVFVISIAKRMSNPKKRQLDILRERLAKGEITQEEYDKLKKEFE